MCVCVGGGGQCIPQEDRHFARFFLRYIYSGIYFFGGGQDMRGDNAQCKWCHVHRQLGPGGGCFGLATPAGVFLQSGAKPMQSADWWRGRGEDVRRKFWADIVVVRQTLHKRILHKKRETNYARQPNRTEDKTRNCFKALGSDHLRIPYGAYIRGAQKRHSFGHSPYFIRYPDLLQRKSQNRKHRGGAGVRGNWAPSGSRPLGDRITTSPVLTWGGGVGALDLAPCLRQRAPRFKKRGLHGELVQARGI